MRSVLYFVMANVGVLVIFLPIEEPQEKNKNKGSTKDKNKSLNRCCNKSLNRC
jgi:hypothetical protein